MICISKYIFFFRIHPYVLGSRGISLLRQMSHGLECDTVAMQHFEWIGIVCVIAETAIQHFYCKTHELVDLTANDGPLHLGNTLHSIPIHQRTEINIWISIKLYDNRSINVQYTAIKAPLSQLTSKNFMEISTTLLGSVTTYKPHTVGDGSSKFSTFLNE